MAGLRWMLGCLIVSCLIVNNVLCASIEELRKTGKLRKGCVSWGNAPQPLRRVFTSDRLKDLRKKMASSIDLGTRPLDAYIVLSTDEHQGVEIEEYDRRLEYISGFSGSYGDAIITRIPCEEATRNQTKCKKHQGKAALWTDGRYHLQADEEIDCNWLLMRERYKDIPTRSQWLKEQFPNGGRVGVYPKLISQHMWEIFEKEFYGTGLELVPLPVSLVDLIWPAEERKAKRSKDAFIRALQYSGENYTIKVEKTRQELIKIGADAMVVTSLDEVAWLLNIRGRDIPYSPFVRAYVILDLQNIFLYVNRSQLVFNRVLHKLNAENPFLKEENSINVKPYEDIWKDLSTKSQIYNKILIPSKCVYSEGVSHSIYSHVFPERRLQHQSPIIYLKAVKNKVERDNMKRAYIKDAAAMCHCLAYIDWKMGMFLKRVKDGEELTDSEKMTELTIAEIVDNCRYDQGPGSLGPSFQTIVAFGSHAAQPRYLPSKNTNAVVFDNSTLVIDSGGQYHEGTTDISRTIHFGTPTEEMKEAYTRVLMGIIQFSNLTFPNNFKMADADALARGPLWEIGLDYLHETGHGVGSFLGVRESPISIQYNTDTSAKEEFKPGYFLSVEPGYYNEGYFGVRLENVLEVEEKPWLHTSGHKFLGFRTMSLVPFEPKLMKLSLLSNHHRRWLNNYNAMVRILVGEELQNQNKKNGFYWMMEKTRHIRENGGFIKRASYSLIVMLNILLLIVFIT